MPFSNQFPKWVLYSLPDGIWVYSLTSFMFINWYLELDKSKYFWLLIGPVLGLSLEFGQLAHIVPGTYDNMDLIICLFASAIPFLIFNYKIKERRIG